MYDLAKLGAVAAALGDFERDCAITVALKISDDSCKMDLYEKQVFMMLYDAIEDKKSNFFKPSVFDLIKEARLQPTAQIYAQVKLQREAAMEHLTRPRMKAFKAQIREALYP